MVSSDSSKRCVESIVVQDAITMRHEILQAYRTHVKETRAQKKRQHKQIILENVRKRSSRLIIKHEATRSQPHYNLQHLRTKRIKESPTRRQQRGNYIKKLLTGQSHSSHHQRSEGWVANALNRAMRKYYRMHQLLERQDEHHFALQSKLLFDECCQCQPLIPGPVTTESGVLRLAGPNLPKIMRILRNEANDGLDLLQPHGLAKYTVMHAAAQRGYTELIEELLMHWNEHPMDSPYQKYSFKQLCHLLELVVEMRKAEKLVSESDANIRALVAEIGVSFAQFSDSIDKLHDEVITLQDLLQICGHPLVLSKDAVGNTPLHYAAEGGHLTLCKLLLANGANINSQNKAGETPLHFAIASQRHGVCLHFVENHADVRISRYVTITTTNGTLLRGNFVESPSGNSMAHLLPSPNFRAGTTGKTHQTLPGACAAVSPEASVENSNTPHDDTDRCKVSTVDTLLRSPFLRTKSHRDIVFFRSAPGHSSFSSNSLGILVISEHVAEFEIKYARKMHEKGKIFHLLIQNVPAAAVLAMNSFRTPLFRCSMLKHVRERNQRWTVSNKLKTPQEKRDALIEQMKGKKRGRSPRRTRKEGLLAQIIARLRKVWKGIRRVRNVLSVQHVFTVTETEAGYKGGIVSEPRGILYEYVYDHAEFRGHHCPTFKMIIQTECKNLIFHPWFRHLLDHKWESFTRQTFRSEFKLYFIYFLAVFIATYLHVGDTYVGMPIGGYRNCIFTRQVGHIEYIRDLARAIYFVINAKYTLQEYQAYRECGSLRVYLRDGWTGFDLVQITCVWLLLVAEIVEFVSPGTAYLPVLLPELKHFSNTFLGFEYSDFTLVVQQESLYNYQIRRKYNFRITLMSIVGPQIFVKWIQFARGTKALGPFVRMIAKMFSDIFVFVMVFCVFLGGFAFAFFILQLEGCKSYFSAVTTTFSISLGSWDWDSIYEGGILAIFFFVAFVVIGTIMLLNLLIAMMGNTYDKIWEDRLLFFELERAKATLSIQMSLDNDVYDEKHWCSRLYVLEGDTPIEGIQFHRL
ncbi:Ca2-permeable cation channel OSM-9 and related channels (OTRPC family) [Plasmopara halstedii]|uniref:Ca2-permeable cation channel OSM-9 and related channels (OTRPC family) n=1 Tax=Plasmopara halstedii TaxID=4781 RepID=A0A0P1B3I9_PLAHL|nr:Ca2-permeable cation channel OSM-9 and related channels (OTRPC family) [Plasmopara halstedii]CEG48109.1 Ca2-permeable cation channel OSM-9 and related channels (OTRPC family) [Plasmopara halstedii]|eukprot:XP_024584478.1 Ca2-permeable cation channel OSM-9 and related channels (OTRPC family) [Plasmopara halstedii]